jgi:hypothetical protein
LDEVCVMQRAFIFMSNQLPGRPSRSRHFRRGIRTVRGNGRGRP